LNIDLDLILEKACWANVRTFHQYYNKEIGEQTEDHFNKILEIYKKIQKLFEYQSIIMFIYD